MDYDEYEIDLIVKPLWRGEECWSECLHLLSIAEAAASVKSIDDGRGQATNDYVVRRRSLLISFFFCGSYSLSHTCLHTYPTN